MKLPSAVKHCVLVATHHSLVRDPLGKHLVESPALPQNGSKHKGGPNAQHGQSYLQWKGTGAKGMRETIVILHTFWSAKPQSTEGMGQKGDLIDSAFQELPLTAPTSKTQITTTYRSKPIKNLSKLGHYI